MKNLFTKVLVGLLGVMMLFTCLGLAEEMPEKQDVIEEETASAADDAIPEDSTMEPMDELIAAEALETVVSETVNVDLDEADSAILGDVLDLTGEDQYDVPSETPLILEAGYEQWFTDEEFRAWVLSKYDGDNSGSLDNTEWAAIKAETTVDLSNAPNKDKIRDLEGIRNFEHLQTIDVSGCTNLTRLFYDDGYYLTNLNVRGCTSLTVLDCPYCKLTNLFLDDCINLETLDCSGNKLESLDVSKLTALKTLNCGSTGIDILNVSNNLELTGLICGHNRLSQIDIKNNTKLRSLHVYDNPLDNLDISNCPELNQCVYNGKSWTEPGTEVTILYYSIDYPDYYCWLGLNKSTTLISVKPADPKPDPDPAPAPAPAPAVVAPAPAPAPATEPITISKTPASTKAKAKKGKVTVTWKKIKKSKKTKALLGQIKSIQVQYSTDPNFATDVNTKTVSKKKTKATLSLQRKTQYYVRVRYVGTDGVSNWGAVKAVKTK